MSLNKAASMAMPDPIRITIPEPGLPAGEYTLTPVVAAPRPYPWPNDAPYSILYYDEPLTAIATTKKVVYVGERVANTGARASVIYLSAGGGKRGPLGQVRGLSGTSDKEPLWIVRNPNDGPLTIDATKGPALVMRDCSDVYFYGFGIHGGTLNDNVVIEDGCSNICFYNIESDGGINGFTFEQSSGNWIEAPYIEGCIIRNTVRQGIYMNGVRGWGINEVLLYKNGTSSLLDHGLYVSEHCGPGEIIRSYAIGSALNGFMVRAGGIIENCMTVDCPNGIAFGGVQDDPDNPYKGESPVSGHIRECAFIRSGAAPWSGVRVNNARGVDISKNVFAYTGQGIVVDGSRELGQWPTKEILVSQNYGIGKFMTAEFDKQVVIELGAKCAREPFAFVADWPIFFAAYDELLGKDDPPDTLAKCEDAYTATMRAALGDNQ